MQNFFVVGILPIIILACSSEEVPVDCENAGPILSVDQIIHATSCSANDGSIQVSISGGLEPYRLFLNDQPIETAGSMNSLSAGVYSVSIKDANNCTSLIDNLSVLAKGFSFTSTIQPSTTCSSGNGEMTINVVGDNPPYSFKLGNVAFTINNFFSGLESGNHIIAIKDNSNCVVNVGVTIPQGFTGTSWVNDVKPIMDKDCAISGCHNGTSRANDFRNYNSAKAFAASIKAKTQDGSMPFDGTLTADQIDIIACWVDDGALQN